MVVYLENSKPATLRPFNLSRNGSSTSPPPPRLSASPSPRNPDDRSSLLCFPCCRGASLAETSFSSSCPLLFQLGNTDEIYVGALLRNTSLQPSHSIFRFPFFIERDTFCVPSLFSLFFNNFFLTFFFDI